MSNLFFKNPLSDEDLKGRFEVRGKDLRGDYFRDSTAIIHSYPFRRLKHKTQVFFAPKNDHICTRIEHVMHVASIASTICRALDLNSDMAWAIGLGHDLGHTPFGHLGERIMADLAGPGDSFRHEVYSLRVVDHLVDYGRGLNLTHAVRDGIVNHCGEKFEKSLTPDFRIRDLSSIEDRTFLPCTWEGVVVRMSDKIAYMGRDLEDGMHLGLVRGEDIPEEVCSVLGRSNSDIIDNLVMDLIQWSLAEGEIGFSDPVYQALLVLKEFNYQRIYKSPQLESYHRNFERILKTLYGYLSGLFDRGGFDSAPYKEEQNALAVRFWDYAVKMREFYEKHDGGYDRMVFDYLAGMTDDFALDCISEIMVPHRFSSQFEQNLFEI